jgi:hypothetical protein
MDKHLQFIYKAFIERFMFCVYGYEKVGDRIKIIINMTGMKLNDKPDLIYFLSPDIIWLDRKQKTEKINGKSKNN